ncbi:MAG: RsmD family RNA methyltransferase [Candidatus Omnitrophota bacterium]|nr:RsmD family RNA methyltransferase [Candidatus Omnitrophota bacterium]
MEITIQKIIYPGKSLGAHGAKTILTDKGIPGEIVEIAPVAEKKNYIEAKTVKIVSPSPHRIAPECSHYRACGAYQDIDYKTQLVIKESQLKEIFPGIPIEVIPSPEIWGYRNKIKLSIIRENKKAYLAYHIPESRNEFIKIDSCRLVSENINRFLALFIDTVNKENLTSVKEIEARESCATKKLIFTTRPFVKIENIQNSSYVEEAASGKIFRIGPESFFQINVPMLEAALKEMQRYISLQENRVIADLYCGIGTFGIAFSQLAEEIIGIESDPGNISFLKGNLKLNKVENFKLYEGQCEKLFPALMNKGVDILILDPPRKGLDNTLCRNILLSSIKKILYLSCNPSTLSRDLKILNHSYAVKILYLLDFFPQTPHIEALAILEKKL